MTRDEIKVYPFEQGKYYVILFDPKSIDVESLMYVAEADSGKYEGIFVPCKDMSKGLKAIEFESQQAIKDWLLESEPTSKP